MSKKIFHIISHTHWDREWYISFEQFRMRLVDLIDNLIELLEKDEEFEYFHLDGQAIILEDYLEIKPNNKEKLLKFIKEGRILVGPFYILNDEFLTSGESHIRNLIIGHKICKEFGVDCMKIGYVPDQFGHISQLPQILNGFGIDNAIFSRGYKCEGNRKAEFIWRTADGSEVIAIAMINWYNNAQRFPADINLSKRLVEYIRNSFEGKTLTNHLLCMNGVDHLEAQENLSGILKELGKIYKNENKFIHSSLPQYVNEIRKVRNKLQKIEGEMREGYETDILTHTISSRVYLKQLNVQATNLIEKWVEPFWSFLKILGVKDYPSEYIEYLWKLLLKNHPHDSICGCSIDAVHRNMLDRFARNLEVSEELIARAFRQFTDLVNRDSLNKDDSLLIVYNPTQEIRSEIIEAQIEFLAEEKADKISIKDFEGEKIPFVQLRKRKLSKRVMSPVNTTAGPSIDRFEISFLAEDIPPFGYKTYIVSKQKGVEIPQIKNRKSLSAGDSIGNKYLKITFNDNGSISIKDKESNNIYENLLLFEDEEDYGDEYFFVKAQDNQVFDTRKCKAKFKLIADNELFTIVHIKTNLKAPFGYYVAPNKRDKSKKDLFIDTYLTIRKDSKRIDVKVKVNNQIYNHRLRVLFPTGINVNESYAGMQFDIVKRPLKLPEKWNRTPDHPSWNFVNISDGKNGLAIFHKGLHCYELKDDKERTLALTLLRGVEWIFGGDRDRDGGKYPLEESYCPDAQCLGENIFEFAIYPQVCNDNLYLRAEEFINSLKSCFYAVDKEKWIFNMPWIQGWDINVANVREDKYERLSRIPLELGLFEIKSKRSVVNAIKKAENNDNIILRIFNPSDKIDNVMIKCHKPLKSVYEVMLSEKRLGKISNKSKSFTFKLIPKKIATYEIELEK